MSAHRAIMIGWPGSAWFAVLLGLLANVSIPAVAGSAPIEAAVPQTSWRVAPGDTVVVVARIENRGPTAVYLNGASCALAPDRPWGVDTSPFFVAAPAILAPFETYDGTLARIVVPANAAAGVTSIEIHLLGGAAEDEGAELAMVLGSISVNLPGCAPAITSGPTNAAVTEGQAAQFTIGVGGGPGTTFQWMKDGVALEDGGRVTGSHSATLQVVDCAPADSGYYTVSLTNTCGEAGSAPAHLAVQAVAGVEVELPRFVAIEAIAPNPTRSFDIIHWALPVRAAVRLEVFDVSGRRQRKLVDGVFPAGRHQVRWEGTDDRGTPLPAGIYLVRLSAAHKLVSRKVTLVR